MYEVSFNPMTHTQTNFSIKGTSSLIPLLTVRAFDFAFAFGL